MVTHLRDLITKLPTVSDETWSLLFTEASRLSISQISTLIEQIFAPLVDKEEPLCYFIVNSLFDCIAHMDITLDQAQFLQLIFQQALRNGNIYTNVGCDGRLAQCLKRVLSDIAGAKQYGILMFNQYVLLQMICNLWMAHSEINFLTVFCQCENTRIALLQLIEEAVHAIDDAVNDTLLHKQDESSLWSDRMQWHTNSNSSSSSQVNRSVTVEQGRNARAYLLFMASKLHANPMYEIRTADAPFLSTLVSSEIVNETMSFAVFTTDYLPMQTHKVPSQWCLFFWPFGPAQ